MLQCFGRQGFFLGCSQRNNIIKKRCHVHFKVEPLLRAKEWSSHAQIGHIQEFDSNYKTSMAKTITFVINYQEFDLSFC